MIFFFWLYSSLILVASWIIYSDCNKQPEEVKTTTYSNNLKPGSVIDVDKFSPDLYSSQIYNQLKRKKTKMTIHEFSIKVAKLEGKKKQVSIAQIKEIMRIINRLLGGQLYKLIRKQ